jgi:octaprenyl-diphosphate synthase
MTQMSESSLFQNPSPPKDEVLTSLASATARAGANTLTARLVELRQWMADDLSALEDSLSPARSTPDGLAEAAANHLMGRPGKRIRPLCVYLSSRIRPGADPKQVRSLAAASELVHAATLLHDDVIDEGTERRGAAAARMVYGNSASVLGGDYLLVEALRRVMETGEQKLLSRLMDAIGEMIRAEAIQLEFRGLFDPDPARYDAVVRGKTAVLFRWAMEAGAAACGASADHITALGNAGESLGVAFQLTDDVLDLQGDAQIVGKTTLTDLREGKLTWPLIVACERDHDLLHTLTAVSESPEILTDLTRVAAIRERILATGCIRTTLDRALAEARTAMTQLNTIPEGRVRDALTAVIQTAVTRAK